MANVKRYKCTNCGFRFRFDLDSGRTLKCGNCGRNNAVIDTESSAQDLLNQVSEYSDR